MNFLQRNSCKLADNLYNYREFSCITRIQLNFYITVRKSAEKEKKIEENTRLCICRDKSNHRLDLSLF